MTDPTQPTVFSDTERDTLQMIVGHIIPADAELSVPGADDESIFADIVRSAHRDEASLHRAVAAVDALASQSFRALPPGEQSAVLEKFRALHPDLARACEVVTARCYYRDARVMRAIGMEVRPPFPIGFDVEPGGLELLEPVRQRGKIYRDAD
jgi:hypothetical protein